MPIQFAFVSCSNKPIIYLISTAVIGAVPNRGEETISERCSFTIESNGCPSANWRKYDISMYWLWHQAYLIALPSCIFPTVE